MVTIVAKGGRRRGRPVSENTLKARGVIFAMRKEGMKLQQIATFLNEHIEDYPTPTKGAKWHPSTVSGVLQKIESEGDTPGRPDKQALASQFGQSVLRIPQARNSLKETVDCLNLISKLSHTHVDTVRTELRSIMATFLEQDGDLGKRASLIATRARDKANAAKATAAQARQEADTAKATAAQARQEADTAKATAAQAGDSVTAVSREEIRMAQTYLNTAVRNANSSLDPDYSDDIRARVNVTRRLVGEVNQLAVDIKVAGERTDRANEKKEHLEEIARIMDGLATEAADRARTANTAAKVSAGRARALADKSRLAEELATVLANTSKLAKKLATVLANKSKLANSMTNEVLKVVEDLTGNMSEATDKARKAAEYSQQALADVAGALTFGLWKRS